MPPGQRNVDACGGSRPVLLRGDEAYAGARSFYVFEQAVRTFYGYEHVIPVHQGRGGENILSRCLIRPGTHVPGNMYFPSTRAHQELNGATFHDVVMKGKFQGMMSAHTPTGSRRV